jgi:PAS domain S-box-containing protein
MIALPGVAIQSKIYESSASLVYRAVREQDGQAIVVKMLKLDYPSPQELTRYKQEYQITRSLNLEGVIKAHSQQEYQRTLVILLEDFGGESLERWMHKRPDFSPMPLSAFLRLAIDLTGILGRIHTAGVIHKDINPGNIVFNPDTGIVKIIDFGIATQFNRTNPTFTSPHVLEGTLAYLSPEQTGRMNRLLDYRTDFYSLGATFYQLLTGHLPFTTTDILELVHCHIARQPIPPHNLNATIPKPVSDIILKLMAKNAEDRYQTAWGIKADLERCLRQLEATGQIDTFQLSLQDVSEQFHIPQKLYGREAEIGVLLAAFERATGKEKEERGKKEESIASSHCEMMLVSGYSGVGKSALVRELYKPITAKRGYFVSGKFDQFQRNIPYSAIAHALQKLVQQLLSEPNEQVQQWRSRLLTALGSNGQLIIDVIPEVELIIGKQPPVAEVGAAEAQNRFNWVFQQFIRVFCSKEHPLVIFLDDLQWIDSATLKLIELMMLDEQTQHLFLIGAYRDNEVTPTHPLALALEELRRQGAVLHEIFLASLALEALNQLVAEALHQDADAVSSLAQLVLRKTEGNPFFVGEFLRSLYSENLLHFDAEQRSWQWSIAEIEAQAITDNVVELLLMKLKKLPENTQRILRLAACIGIEFDLETLAIVCEQSLKTVFQDLLAATQAGFIQPLSELDENLLVQEYKFLHDRIQQAAYVLIDESHKHLVHLQIGRNLLAKTLPEQLPERLFEIVDHLNHGIEIVTEQAERDEIARLNLIAGRKALAATAYEAAFKYFNTGLKLLNMESWQREYDLTLALHSEAAEAAYLGGHFDEMERLVEEVLNHAKTVLDKVKAYDSKIQAWLSQGDPKEALKIGLKVLQLLGISLVEAPSQLDVQTGLEETASRFAGRKIEDLVDLPEMIEPLPLAAIYILASIVGAAFMVSPALMVLIVCEMVKLSIAYGNSIWSPHSYAGYGMTLCGVVQDTERGYQFGKLSLSLVERSTNKKGHSKALLVLGSHVMHWKDSLRKTLPILVSGYHSGVETGDFEFAGYCAFNLCYYSYFAGEELTELEQQTAIYRKATSQIRRENPFDWLTMLQQTIRNLLGWSENSSRLMGEIYNEEQALSRAIAVKDGTGIHHFYLNKLILCYLFGEYHQAAQTAALAEQYLGEVTALISVPLFHFYDSLILLSLLPDVSNSEKEVWLDRVNLNQEKMQEWAHHAPMNYLHKFQLVEAEKARVLGQLMEAEEFYEQAIQGARDNEYLQEEALAYELAAKFHLERGRSKFAQTYMKEAHYCYERWGAMAKVKDLETRYPQFFAQPSGTAGTRISKASKTTSNPSPITFDLATVMKASQAIAREIELDQLLRSLMQILIENAGAQIGFLILEESGEWAIEAACELNGENQVCDTQVLQSLPVANRLPESMIQYVIRTHESVILNDATHEGNFINDFYIQHHQSQSVMCLPLLNQSKLVGVLYLENRLVTGAFTAERSQLLNLLSTQAAIAIENARLYSALRASKSQMTQFLEAVPVGIAVFDAVGRPYYFNQRATQLIGKGSDPAVPPDQLSEAYQVYLAGTKQPYPIERLPSMRALSGERSTVDDVDIHQNDTIIPVEVWSTPVFDEQGNVTYALAAFQDITQRKQTEQLLANYNRTLEQQVAERTAALQRSEAELRDVCDELRLRERELLLITDALPVCISYLDANRRYRFVNRTYEDWFSRSRDQILGKYVWEILGEKAYQVVETHINQVFAGQTVTLEAEMPLPSGKKYIKATLIPNFDDNNQVIGFYALNTDISDYKQAEAALKASEAELRDREQELRLITDALPVGIGYVDTKQYHQFVNYIYEVWLNCSRDEILGRSVREVVGETIYQMIEPYINQVLAGHTTTLEMEMSLPTGKKYINSTLIPDFDSDAQVRGYYGLHIDVSDRKRGEEASILEERNRMAREIHDSLAQAFTGILLQVGSVTQMLTDAAGSTQVYLKRLERIDELARTGLAEARRSVVALRPQLLEEGNLQNALHRLVTQMQSTTKTTLIYESNGTAYSLPTEVENHLLRIGQEALTNAIKYANADKILVELVYEDAQCLLRVKDDGQGFGVGSISSAGGFGLLGMSERAERIGAQLTIQSQPGQGTEITVTVNQE